MPNYKGIILAGGSGTPMIYYPLSVLMLAGIREVLIITTPQDAPMFRHLLGDGSQWGMSLQYREQPKPEGLAQAFIIGREFVGNDPSCLILGDNIFYGHGLTESLKTAATRTEGATVFGYWVNDPERYGVAEFDASGRVIGLVEKPSKPKSNYAVTGLYFYDNQVVDMARDLKPGVRGELEITDINKLYLAQNQLQVEKLGRGIAWLDTGTHASLLQASNFIQTIEERQGLKISCPEEIAWSQGWITSEQLIAQAEPLRKSNYGEYLLKLLNMERPA